MTSVVRLRDTISSAAWISCSVFVSRAKVASSRIRIRRRLQDGSRDRNALLSPPKVSGRARPPWRGSLPQVTDEIGDLRRLGGWPRPPHRSPSPAVTDIVGDRIVEKNSVLRHHADHGAQALLGDVTHVLTVDGDRAFLTS